MSDRKTVSKEDEKYCPYCGVHHFWNWGIVRHIDHIHGDVVHVKVRNASPNDSARILSSIVICKNGVDSLGKVAV